MPSPNRGARIAAFVAAGALALFSFGLIAAAGGVFRIVDHLPRKIAMELLFTGSRGARPTRGSGVG